MDGVWQQIRLLYNGPNGNIFLGLTILVVGAILYISMQMTSRRR